MIRSMQATGIVQGTLAGEGEGGEEETLLLPLQKQIGDSTSTSTVQARNSSVS